MLRTAGLCNAQRGGRFKIGKQLQTFKPEGIMEAKASARFIRVSPRKARVVADLVRGKDVGDALKTLTFTKKYVSETIKKLVESAMANAKHADSAIDVDGLYIKELTVDMGPQGHMRRWRPRAMGRATRIVKGTSHIKVTLAQR